MSEAPSVPTLERLDALVAENRARAAADSGAQPGRAQPGADVLAPDAIKADVDNRGAKTDAAVATSGRVLAHTADVLAAAPVPESEEIVIRVAPPADDSPMPPDPVGPEGLRRLASQDSDDEERPREARLPRLAETAVAAAPADPDRRSGEAPSRSEVARSVPRRLAGVCDEGTWRRFVPAVLDKVADVARRVVGDDEFDVVPFVRAAIEGMSFSSESARFSTLGMDVGVPGATPQCIDLLGGLARVSAARATQNGEYAAHFATVAALQTHLVESGARVCALPFTESWMVIAAASARQGVWAPLRLKRKAAAEDEAEGEALAAMLRAMDGPPEEEAPKPVRAGRKKRKREEE